MPRIPRPPRNPVHIPGVKPKRRQSFKTAVRRMEKSQRGLGDLRRMVRAHEKEIYPWKSDLRPNPSARTYVVVHSKSQRDPGGFDQEFLHTSKDDSTRALRAAERRAERHALKRPGPKDLHMEVVQSNRRIRSWTADSGEWREEMRKNSTKIEIYANPYANPARGFYFGDLEELEEGLSKSLYEEFELDWINGPEIDRRIFKTASINLGSIEDYFDAMETLSEEEKATVYLLLSRGATFDDATSKADEAIIFEGSAKDYVVELLEEVGISNEMANMYFDYEYFGRDLSLSGDLTSSLEEDAEEAEEQGDLEEAERLREEVERLNNLSDEELGWEFVESIGSLEDAVGAPQIARYFDYGSFARDMEMNGEIEEFKMEGQTYVLTNALEMY